MKKKICIVLLMMLWAPFLYAGDASIFWNTAVDYAKRGENDFAFINFHMLVDSYPDFKKRSAAEFAMGEYYFKRNDLRSAVEEFENVYAAAPKSREALVALAYLYKIARSEGRNDASEEYRKKMIAAHPVTFIFKDKESVQYLSGFQRAYDVVIYIDRIEVLADGKLFVEVRD